MFTLNDSKHALFWHWLLTFVILVSVTGMPVASAAFAVPGLILTAMVTSLLDLALGLFGLSSIDA
ncbi:hypothetical protein [Hydrogenimonas sp.]